MSRTKERRSLASLIAWFALVWCGGTGMLTLAVTGYAATAVGLGFAIIAVYLTEGQ